MNDARFTQRDDAEATDRRSRHSGRVLPDLRARGRWARRCPLRGANRRSTPRTRSEEMRLHHVAAPVLVLVALGCQPAAPTTSRIDPWLPIDAAFAGCAGSCGALADHALPGVVEQPARPGQRTYCPV